MIELASPLREDCQQLAARVLQGEAITPEQALELLQTPNEQILQLLAAAYEIRKKHYGNRVKLNYLVNARSGACQEDCGYCSQSKVADTDIDRYGLINEQELLEGAQRAVDHQASTCCLVTSARGPSDRDIDRFSSAVQKIKEEHPQLKICACLGLLKEGQAERLQDAGVDRYNHNLNTADSHHEKIVSTHTYDDRVDTVEKSKEAGISPCSGVIVGMGETPQQLVDVAFALKNIDADSIPVNFLIPVKGTRLGDMGEELTSGLSPQWCLKVLAMFRFVNPSKEIRLSAGREVHLGTLQPMAFYAANSMFVSDYLTEPGQDKSLDYQIIEDLGFEID